MVDKAREEEERLIAQAIKAGKLKVYKPHTSSEQEPGKKLFRFGGLAEKRWISKNPAP